MIKSYILGIVSFIIFLVAHFVVFRVFLPKERVKTTILVSLFIIPAYILLYLIFPTEYMVLTPVGDRAFMPWLSMEMIYKLTGIFYFMTGLVVYGALVLAYLIARARSNRGYQT